MSIIEKISQKIKENTSKEEYLDELKNFLISIIKKINEMKTNECTYQNNLDSFIQEITNLKCFQFNDYISFIDDSFGKKINYDDNGLCYINSLLIVLFNLKIIKKNKYTKKHFSLEISDLHAYESLKWKLKLLDHYLLELNDNEIHFKDEKEIIDIIDNKNLSELFYDYKSSKTFKEKEKSIRMLSDKIVHFWNHKEKPDCTKILSDKFGKNKFNEDIVKEICGKLHGYFRHNKNNSNGEQAQEWEKFDEEKKIKIMEETFLDILYSLALLRINGISIEIK